MIRHWLRGTGRFGDARRAELDGEGIVLLVDAVKGTLTWRHYRGPDRIASFRRQGIYASLAITGRRVCADKRSGPLLDVPWDHPVVGTAVQAGLDDAGGLLVAWDCGALHPDRRGRQELRLRAPDAARAVALLRERGIGPVGA